MWVECREAGGNVFFKLRVDSAIARLGVDPRAFNKDFHSGAKQVGKRSGNSPQEVAVVMIAQLPVVDRVSLDVELIRKWAAQGKINTEREEVREALSEFDL